MPWGREKPPAEASYVSGGPDKLRRRAEKGRRETSKCLFSNLTSSRLTSPTTVQLTDNSQPSSNSQSSSHEHTHTRKFHEQSKTTIIIHLKIFCTPRIGRQGRTRTARSLSLPREGDREAKQVGSTISLCQRYRKTTIKCVPSPSSQQHYNILQERFLMVCNPPTAPGRSGEDRTHTTYTGG